MTVSLFMRRLTAAVVISLVALAVSARADVQEKTMTVGRITVHYKVVLPNGYDPSTRRGSSKDSRRPARAAVRR